MTKNADSQIETLREKIRNGERELDDANQEALLKFSNGLFLIPSQVGDQRHLKLLRHNVRMAEHAGSPVDALESEDAAKEIVRWIHRTYDNPETNRDYRVALKQFGRRVTDRNGDDPPESMAWIPSNTPSTYDPAPEPSDMLQWKEDVLPLIEATRNARDAALIAVAWDAGPRSGELRSLTLGDVTEYAHGYQITVRGKMGQRTVPLIPSVPFLQRWFADHPGADPDAPLWAKLTAPEAPSYNALRTAVKDAADRAGVSKPVTFTNLRKSSASHLASRGLNQAHIEDHHGWTRGSDVASRYVSVFADDTGREVARAHGLEISDAEEPESTAPVECPRCHQRTPREKDRCLHCRQPIDKESALREQQTCDWCGAAIANYSDHIPNCSAVHVSIEGK
ncbi:tyrosine-type recombinase/integrase [Halorussus limi]|uniref:Tyrosine-type recombinase/integrase n=2 Tax=Halorussus TaxID=1070314 RepID=A0A8U0IGT5_9EURY|nr:MULTISPECIES: tyrosine-type recombinase/integrase [Halorussus]UPV73878.1 tyrosine-type recombinase/integrase [Halorussus limi]UPV99895.1 tyrosine-type recombinase/integrase [Halorussus gelatinilyticus]